MQDNAFEMGFTWESFKIVSVHPFHTCRASFDIHLKLVFLDWLASELV